MCVCVCVCGGGACVCMCVCVYTHTYIYDRLLIIPRCFRYAADVLFEFLCFCTVKITRKEEIVKKLTITSAITVYNDTMLF